MSVTYHIGEDTYSWLNLGCMLNWGLYGALCAQVYLYYLAFPEDRTLNKVLVYGVYFLETVQTMLLLFDSIYMSRSLAVMSTSSSNQPFQTQVLPTSTRAVSMLQYNTIYNVLWIAIPLLGGFVTFVVQSFYAYRLYIFARSWVITSFIILFAFIQFMMTITGGAILFPGSISVDIGPSAGVTALIFQITWGGLSMVCDIVIAIFMTYFLLRNDSDWKSTHTLLVKLVRLAVETGTATVVVCVIYVVFSLTSESAGDACVPALVLAKVYSNAMMANFNHRIQIIGGRNDDQTTSYMMPPSMSAFPDYAVPADSKNRQPESAGRI